jgi:hypothetical protein
VGTEGFGKDGGQWESGFEGLSPLIKFFFNCMEAIKMAKRKRKKKATEEKAPKKKKAKRKKAAKKKK